MAASKSTQAEVEYRVNRFVRIVSNGGRRSDCIRFAAENWGVSERTVDTYLKKAREKMKEDFDIDRPQMIADLLGQLSTIQMEARRAGQLHVALGAINTAARLTSLCS